MYIKHLSNIKKPEKAVVLVIKVAITLVLLMAVMPSFADVKSISAGREVVDESGVTYRELDITCTNTKTKYLIARAQNEKQWCYNGREYCSPKRIGLAEKICSKAVIRNDKRKDREPINRRASVAISDFGKEQKLQNELLDVQQEILDIKEKLLALRKQEIVLRSNNF